jgi:hypothetical protein
VEVLTVSPETDKRRETFLRLLFGNNEGYLCIAYGPKDRDPKKFRQEYFKYPNEIPQALDLINKTFQGNNVWFCPHLLAQKRRQKQDVSVTTAAWSDLDECQPTDLLLAPTILIESSPGRWQGLWMFDSQVNPDDAENVSQRIAYHHAEDGADRTGWDLGQLLRMPYTYNYKYATTPTILITDANRKRYRLSDFDKHYEPIATYQPVTEPMPDISMINGDELLDKQRLQLSPTVWRLYNEKLADSASWSEPLWKLMMMLFEAGFDKPQVFAIVQDAACNKWDKHASAQQSLWNDVVRAHTKHGLVVEPIITAKGKTFDTPLVSDEEKRQVEGTDSFVERYIEWARGLGDAAPQYHQAGAFTVLSSLLAGNVQLPTSFGIVKPNLWFMILADTTLTRKSTAMDIAMDLVMEIDDDVLMATDGSIEGLLTSMSTRTGRTSVFLRDEFSGLLEMITKKDYYAGMPELLTKLYDGRPQKRILRKEAIEIRDPCLIVFAGGIKNKITSLLSFEHVSSGFMPRFVFITAESDIAKVKPLGPPTDWTDNNRSVLLNELQDMYAFYNQTTVMTIKDSNITFDSRVKFNAMLTPEAWYRYNTLESLMLDGGINSDRAEIMTPVYDRLSKSILKASVLLAASREFGEKVIVTEEDVVRAATYGEGWRIFVQEVMDNVGKGQYERQLDNILRMVHREPGVTRSRIMQAYHLTARDTSAAFETLEQRGLVQRTKQGRGETLFPTEIQIRSEA